MNRPWTYRRSTCYVVWMRGKLVCCGSSLSFIGIFFIKETPKQAERTTQNTIVGFRGRHPPFPTTTTLIPLVSYWDIPIWTVCALLWLEKMMPKFKRYWITCSKYNNHIKLHNQHKWEKKDCMTINLHWNLHFDNEQDVHMNSQKELRPSCGFANHLILIVFFIS